jgi:hypothetical protein
VIDENFRLDLIRIASNAKHPLKDKHRNRILQRLDLSLEAGGERRQPLRALVKHPGFERFIRAGRN